MGRCSIQIVMGPAGSGKSTYCHSIQNHCAISRKRRIHVGNLDPAAEDFGYDMNFDVRDLISVDDVMEELGLGPNGSLIYCMEYLLDHLDDWLYDHLNGMDDDEMILLDCPGQLELYTHVPVMRRIVDRLRTWGYEPSMMGVFCIDATFLCDASKFLSGSLLALTAMIALELPHVNLLTKCDLMSNDDIQRMLSMESATQLWNEDMYHRHHRHQRPDHRHDYFNVVNNIDDDNDDDNDDDHENDENDEAEAEVEEQQPSQRQKREERQRQQHRLTAAISSLLDDFTMVSFLPLNILDEESLDHVVQTVDHTVQYGEKQEVNTGDDNDDGDGYDLEGVEEG